MFHIYNTRTHKDIYTHTDTNVCCPAFTLIHTYASQVLLLCSNSVGLLLLLFLVKSFMFLTKSINCNVVLQKLNSLFANFTSHWHETRVLSVPLMMNKLAHCVFIVTSILKKYNKKNKSFSNSTSRHDNPYVKPLPRAAHLNQNEALHSHRPINLCSCQ